MSAKQSLDADLLAAVPDADAVRALYERHVDAVFRFAIRRCRSPEDVADLVSTVFLELFSAAPSYDRRRGEVRADRTRGRSSCPPLPKSCFLTLSCATCRQTRPGSVPHSTGSP